MFQSLGAKTFILPTPVFLVGTYDHTGRPNIMTAAWGGICASQPPSIAVSIRKSRWTYNAILERKSFTINIPSRKLAAQSDFAGMHSGRDTDKFTALNLTPTPAEHVDAPGIAECPVIVELTLSHTLELGSHTQFIGEIMDVKVDSACMREDGLPDPALIDPLLFAPLVQEYWAISQFEARAFSAGHALTHSANSWVGNVGEEKGTFWEESPLLPSPHLPSSAKTFSFIESPIHGFLLCPKNPASWKYFSQIAVFIKTPEYTNVARASSFLSDGTAAERFAQVESLEERRARATLQFLGGKSRRGVLTVRGFPFPSPNSSSVLSPTAIVQTSAAPPRRDTTYTRQNPQAPASWLR